MVILDSIWLTISSGLDEDPDYPKTIVSSLTSSKCGNIGENHFNWAKLQPNSKIPPKLNKFIDVFTMVH